MPKRGLFRYLNPINPRPLMALILVLYYIEIG
nr:MAG TPA: hypothetical protein [Caudoviricetes sp.]